MQFELAHLSLLEREQGSLLGAAELTREQWLRSIFSRRIDFVHRKQAFYYVPQQNWAGTDSPIVVGRIGRTISVQENAPPEGGFEEIERASWRACLVLLDPRHHDDGQKIAVEENNLVGRPIPLLESLVNQINLSNYHEQYFLEVAPISEQATFWDFVQKNKGQITSVDFTFVAPNMWVDDDDFEKEMKDLRERNNAQTAHFGIESDEGLELETERIKQAVKYAAKGGGSVRARAKNGAKFNSKKRAKKRTVREKKSEKIKFSALIKKAILTIFTT